jgi:hypothetical protein
MCSGVQLSAAQGCAVRDGRKNRPRREPRTLAQQIAGETIVCLRCGQTKPAAGSRPFHGQPVCSDFCAQLDKLTTKGVA